MAVFLFTTQPPVTSMQPQCPFTPSKITLSLALSSLFLSAQPALGQSRTSPQQQSPNNYPTQPLYPATDAAVPNYPVPNYPAPTAAMPNGQSSYQTGAQLQQRNPSPQQQYTPAPSASAARVSTGSYFSNNTSNATIFGDLSTIPSYALVGHGSPGVRWAAPPPVYYYPAPAANKASASPPPQPQPVPQRDPAPTAAQLGQPTATANYPSQTAPIQPKPSQAQIRQQQIQQQSVPPVIKPPLPKRPLPPAPLQSNPQKQPYPAPLSLDEDSRAESWVAYNRHYTIGLGANQHQSESVDLQLPARTNGGIRTTDSSNQTHLDFSVRHMSADAVNKAYPKVEQYTTIAPDLISPLNVMSELKVHYTKGKATYKTELISQGKTVANSALSGKTENSNYGIQGRLGLVGVRLPEAQIIPYVQLEHRIWEDQTALNTDKFRSSAALLGMMFQYQSNPESPYTIEAEVATGTSVRPSVKRQPIGSGATIYDTRLENANAHQRALRISYDLDQREIAGMDGHWQAYFDANYHRQKIRAAKEAQVSNTPQSRTMKDTAYSIGLMRNF